MLLWRGYIYPYYFHVFIPYSIVTLHKYSVNEVLKIKIYKQIDVIKDLKIRTGCSPDDISYVINSLGDMVKEKFSDSEDKVEIKLFPGLKVTSKYIPSEQSVSKNLNINSDYSIFMTATFSDDFRKKVRELHNKKYT